MFILVSEITMKIYHPTRRNGFTLVELMGAVVISLIIILLLYQIFDKVQSVFTVSQNRARTMEQGRVAMDMLVNDFQALAPAALNDTIGEIPNIEWAELPVKDYLSPVRMFYIQSIDYDAGVLEVENQVGPATNDIVFFPDSLANFGQGRVINPAQRQFAFLRGSDKKDPFINYKGLTGLHEPLDEARRVEVNMDYIPHSRWQFYQSVSQDLCRQECAFFTNDEGWRYVKYRFGGRENYYTMNLKDPTGHPTTPVGALWVYRSRVVPRSGLLTERADHRTLMMHDLPKKPGLPYQRLDDPVGFAKVMDGVIHFRVRAVSPLDPAKAMSSPANSFYNSSLAPSHVEVELAVADESLVLRMEEGIEQQLENVTDPRIKYRAKMKYLSQNLDRIYFFKQLIPIKGEGP
jgi:prepilin-type N-terminal cleavage/methylation domain-containing protein